MEAGLIWSVDTWEASIDADASYSTEGLPLEWAAAYNYEAVGATHYAVPGTFQTGLYLRAWSGFDSLVPAYWEAEASGFGISWSDTGSGFRGAQQLVLTVSDLKLYVTSSDNWLLEWSGASLDYNGATVASVGAGSASGSSALLLSPASIPIIGIPMCIEGWAAASTVPAVPDPSAPGYSEISGTISGGWRFDQGDGWETLPVQLPGYTLPPPIDPSWTASTTQLTATSTYGAQMSVYARDDAPLVGYHLRQKRIGRVRLVPNLPKKVNRWHSAEYAALIVRGASPTLKQWAQRRKTPAPPDFVPFATIETQLNPSSGDATQMLGVVTGSAHVIEQPLGETTYAPFWLSSEKWLDGDTPDDRITVYYPSPNMSAAGCPAYLASHSDPANFPLNLLVTPSQPSTMAEQLLARETSVLQFWSSPLWNYWYWFPSDDLTKFGWEIDGATVRPWGYVDPDLGFVQGYWLWAGDQHLTHPDLPPEQNIRTRTSLVSAPLVFGALATGSGDEMVSTMDRIVGQKTSWWGISRFDVHRGYGPGTLAPGSGSGSRWTSPDTSCTASAGASTVVLTPTVGAGAGTIQIDIELGRYSEEPYQRPCWFDKVDLGWSATNVSSVKVYAVGIDGSLVPITDDVQGEYSWPVDLQATKYAGSWKQDFSAGSVDVSDQGADEDASGISAATFLDPARAAAYRLLPGRTAFKLRYVIDVVDRALTATIDQPVFRKPAKRCQVEHETAHQQSAAFPAGPGVRFGNQSYWDYSLDSFSDPPIYMDPGSKPTVLDWLCHRKHWWYGQSTSAVASEVEGLYDATERGGAGSLKSAAYYTTVFWVTPPAARGGGTDPYAVLLNTYRAVPPLACFPERRRTADTAYDPTLDYGCEVWSLARHGRAVLTPGALPSRLEGGSPETDWLGGGSTVAGWRLDKHQHPVEGTEDLFHLRRGTGTYGKEIRPWHGLFWVGQSAPEAEGGPWNCGEIYGDYARVWTEDGTVKFVRSDHGVPALGFDVSSDVQSGGSSPRIAQDARRRYWCLYERSGDVRTRWSEDDGRTWEAESVLIASAKWPCVASSRDGGLLFAAFTYVSGSSGPGYLKYRYQGPGDTAPSAAASAQYWNGSSLADLQLADQQFSICRSYELGGRWVLACVIDGETGVSEWASADEGSTWTRID